MTDSTPSLDDLRAELEEQFAEAPPSSDEPMEHAEWMAHACSIICEAFERHRMRATMVGGGAVEFHAPGTYVSDDSDFVVERFREGREALDAVFSELGFTKSSARHWKWNDRFFVEVPSSYLEGEAEEYRIHTHTLRVVKKECVLAERVAEYYNTGHTGRATQAIQMIAAFGDDMDRELLDRELGDEKLRRLYDSLERLSTEGVEVTAEILKEKRRELRGKPTAE